MEAVKSYGEVRILKNDLKKQTRQLFIKRILSNKSAIIGLVLVLFLIGLALIGPLLVSHDPYEMKAQNRLLGHNAEFLLGTDNFGRDLFSRIVYGSRVSLTVGFAVAVLTSIIGLIIGLYASYYRSLDNILMRICDGLMAFPGLLLAIAIMTALGPSTQNVIITLSIVYTPHIARVVRSSALVIRKETYIEAIQAQGASAFRTIWLHMAPNTLSSLIVQSTFIFADAIIVEAALSFLGAGVPAPHPSWGNILYDGKQVIFDAWWMTVFPGICLVLSVLGLNLFGDGIRDVLDPHTKAK